MTYFGPVLMDSIFLIAIVELTKGNYSRKIGASQATGMGGESVRYEDFALEL